jgi:hypothetical protein
LRTFLHAPVMSGSTAQMPGKAWRALNLHRIFFTTTAENDATLQHAGTVVAFTSSDGKRGSQEENVAIRVNAGPFAV